MNQNFAVDNQLPTNFQVVKKLQRGDTIEFISQQDQQFQIISKNNFDISIYFPNGVQKYILYFDDSSLQVPNDTDQFQNCINNCFNSITYQSNVLKNYQYFNENYIDHYSELIGQIVNAYFDILTPEDKEKYLQNKDDQEVNILITKCLGEKFSQLLYFYVGQLAMSPFNPELCSFSLILNTPQELVEYHRLQVQILVSTLLKLRPDQIFLFYLLMCRLMSSEEAQSGLNQQIFRACIISLNQIMDQLTKKLQQDIINFTLEQIYYNTTNEAQQRVQMYGSLYTGSIPKNKSAAYYDYLACYQLAFDKPIQCNDKYISYSEAVIDILFNNIDIATKLCVIYQLSFDCRSKRFCQEIINVLGEITSDIFTQECEYNKIELKLCNYNLSYLFQEIQKDEQLKKQLTKSINHLVDVYVNDNTNIYSRICKNYDEKLYQKITSKYDKLFSPTGYMQMTIQYTKNIKDIDLFNLFVESLFFQNLQAYDRNNILKDYPLFKYINSGSKKHMYKTENDMIGKFYDQAKQDFDQQKIEKIIKNRENHAKMLKDALDKIDSYNVQKQEENKTKVEDIEEDENEDRCSICFDLYKDNQVQLQCKHKLCDYCFAQIKKTECPICGQRIQKFTYKDLEISLI